MPDQDPPDATGLDTFVASELPIAPVGTKGGCEGSRRCAPGAVLVGFESVRVSGFYKDSITKLLPRCAPVLAPTLSAPATLGAAKTIGPAPGINGSAVAVTSSCPANQAVVGIRVEQPTNSTWALPGNIILSCAPLAVRANGEIDVGVIGPGTTNVPVTNLTLGSAACPVDKVAGGTPLFVGQVVNEVGLYCQSLQKKP